MLQSATLIGLVVAVTGSLPDDYPTVPMKGINGPMRMPLIGFGTWEYNESFAETTVATAFRLGYRAVDTAVVYDNHKGVGRALAKSGLKREEYFVTTKIGGGLNASETKASLDQSLAELNLDYVDLMLVHYPADWDAKITDAASRQEQWLAMEKWAKTGKARALGISHYCRQHLDDVLSVASVPVSLNQVQYHVGMGSASDLHQHNRQYMEQLGVVFMSYSTLCGPCPDGGNAELLTGDLVTGIGKAHGKSGAQVSLRWAVQQGIPVVPKSSNEHHMLSNADLFDFVLTQQEMAQLSSATSPPLTSDDAGDCDIGGGAITVEADSAPDLATGFIGGAIGLALGAGGLASLWLCVARRARRGTEGRRLHLQLVGEDVAPTA